MRFFTHLPAHELHARAVEAMQSAADGWPITATASVRGSVRMQAATKAASMTELTKIKRSLAPVALT